MSILETSPTFNLKAVVLETGLKPHTLRSWERKYGLPRPLRTEGKHRVYTQKDIDTVKWLIARLEEGITISRAVELWYHLESKGENPLVVAAYQTRELPATSTAGDALTNLRQKFVENCLKFDRVSAESVLTQAFAIYPVEMVCRELLQKGLHQIGKLWFQNEATVQQEHFTSALIIERLNALIAAAPQPNRLGRILVATPPHEEHTIALLSLSLLLRYRGWDVVYLGGNVPIFQLGATVEAIKPNLVVLAAQRLQTAANLAKTTRFLTEKKVPAAFGGLIFNLITDLRHRVHGHFLGEGIDDAVTIIGQVMAFNPPLSQVEPPSPAYQRAANHYQACLHLIELDTRQIMENQKLPLHFVSETNSRLARDILAALKLGDMNFINPEIELSRKLIANYNISSEWQSNYMNAYFHAAWKNLDRENSPIVTWLDQARSALSAA